MRKISVLPPVTIFFFEQLQGFALESQTLMVTSTEFMENI